MKKQKLLYRQHEILLRDKNRTLAYKKAIEKTVKKNDVVLDLGCGSGIFSFMAAQKGCAKVYAVENTEIIRQAKETALSNRLEDKIEFHHTDIMKFIPDQKIDVLIHEQIGSFIWNEDMLEKVKYIRENFTEKKIKIIPAGIDIYAAPVCHKNTADMSYAFWGQKPYGFDFSNFQNMALIENIRNGIYPAILNLKNRSSFIAGEKRIHRIDFRKTLQMPEILKTDFKILRPAGFTGICVYFKAHLGSRLILESGPGSNTHWGQIFLFRFRGLPVNKGDILSFILYPDTNPLKWKYHFSTKK